MFRSERLSLLYSDSTLRRHCYESEWTTKLV